MTDNTTEVAVAEVTQVLPAESEYFPAPTTTSIQRIQAQADALDMVYAFATRLSKTPLVPECYQYYNVPKNKSEIRGAQAAADLTVAILYGDELGLTALQSAQNVFAVGGKPSVYAKTMVAQVLAWIEKNGTGGVDGDGLWEVSAAPGKVVWAGRRGGKTAASEWTIERATTAGFTKNPKYAQQPTEMLRAKAQTEVCRILYPDVLLGMSHSIEELQLDTVTVQRVAPTPARGSAGVDQLIANRQQQRAVEQRHPAEPGPADQSVDQAPLPPQHPVPANQDPDLVRMFVDAAKEDPTVLEDLKAIKANLEAKKARAAGPAPGAGDDPPASGSGAPADDPADLESASSVTDELITAVTAVEGPAAEVNSRGELFATENQRANLDKALAAEKIPVKDRLEYVAQLIARELPSLDDLSETEADEVLSVLAAPAVNGGDK